MPALAMALRLGLRLRGRARRDRAAPDPLAARNWLTRVASSAAIALPGPHAAVTRISPRTGGSTAQWPRQRHPVAPRQLRPCGQPLGRSSDRHATVTPPRGDRRQAAKKPARTAGTRLRRVAAAAEAAAGSSPRLVRTVAEAAEAAEAAERRSGGPPCPEERAAGSRAQGAPAGRRRRRTAPAGRSPPRRSPAHRHPSSRSEVRTTGGGGTDGGAGRWRSGPAVGAAPRGRTGGGTSAAASTGTGTGAGAGTGAGGGRRADGQLGTIGGTGGTGAGAGGGGAATGGTRRGRSDTRWLRPWPPRACGALASPRSRSG